MAALLEILEFPSGNGTAENAEPVDGKDEANSPSSDNRSGSSIGLSPQGKKRKRRNSMASNVTAFASRVSNSPPKAAGKNRSSPQRIFEKGDIVWAKAFPYTRWPGRIEDVRVSTALVSFFGCDKTRWFQISEIGGFEENYTRMFRMVGVKLSDEIGLALEELSRQTVLGLTCPCRDSSMKANYVSVDRIAEAKKGFEPRKMLDFVHDMAVSARVGAAETASVVRASAQVNAYRRYVLVCWNIEANIGCGEADVDDYSSIDEEETTAIANAYEVAQLNPYQHTMEIGDDLISLPEGSDQEGHEPSSESAMVCGGSREPEYDCSIEVFEEQVQGGSDICIINRQDFNTLDLDEECKSLIDNQAHAVTDWSRPACTSSQESDAEAAYNKSICHASYDYQDVANEIGLCVMEGSLDSLPSYDANLMRKNIDNIWESGHIVKSGKDVAFSNYLTTIIETDMVERLDEKATSAEHETNESASLLVSTAGRCLLKTAPCEEEKLLIQPASKCETRSLDEKLKHSINFQSSIDNEGTANIFSCLSLPTKIASESVQKRRNQTITCDNNLMNTFETDMVEQQDEKATAVGHETSVSASLCLSTSDSLPSAAPCEEGRLLIYLPSKCDTHSPGENLKHSVKFQSSPKASFVVDSGNADREGSANSVSGMSPPKIASLRAQKRCDQTIDCNDSNIQRTLTPHSKAISYTSPIIQSQSTTYYTSHSNHEAIADAATKKAVFLAKARPHSVDSCNIVSRKNKEKGEKTETGRNSTLARSVSKSSFQWKKGLEQSTASGPSKWQSFYASPLVADCSDSTSEAKKSSATDRSSSFAKLLHMKFPKDFNLPSKEEVEEKFRVFGPLDCSKTRLFLSTGAGYVVFVHHADAYAAYKYVKKRNIFGQANVRFWLDRYGNFRKGRETQDSSVPLTEPSSSNLKSCTRDLSVPTVGHSSSNLKSCLKRPNVLLGCDTMKKFKVRFLMET